MARPRWTAVQVTFLGGAGEFLSPRCARDIASSRRQRLENRVEVLNDRNRSTDHLAIAALESPGAAAGTYVDILDAARLKLLGPANVVDVVGVAAVDDDVAFLQLG